MSLVRFGLKQVRYVSMQLSFTVELIMLYTRRCEWSRAEIECTLAAIGTRDCL